MKTKIKMDDKEDRLRFWQEKTMEQFTKVIEILLLISSAFLGYLVSFKIDKSLSPTWLVELLIGITVCIIIILVFLSFNRLRDFRLTQRRIRKGDISSEKIRGIGNNSWNLMFWALMLFAIDIILFFMLIMLN